jgi:hypothetical protein
VVTVQVSKRPGEKILIGGKGVWQSLKKVMC